MRFARVNATTSTTHLLIPPGRGQARRGTQRTAHLVPPHDEYRSTRCRRCHCESSAFLFLFTTVPALASRRKKRGAAAAAAEDAPPAEYVCAARSLESACLAFSHESPEQRHLPASVAEGPTAGSERLPAATTGGIARAGSSLSRDHDLAAIDYVACASHFARFTLAEVRRSCRPRHRSNVRNAILRDAPRTVHWINDRDTYHDESPDGFCIQQGGELVHYFLKYNQRIVR